MSSIPFLTSLIRPIAYISVPLIILRTSQTGRYFFRQGVYLSAMVTVAACSAVLAAGMTLVGKREDVNYMVARSFWCLAGTVLGVEVEVEGEENLYYLGLDEDGGGEEAEDVDVRKKKKKILKRKRRSGSAVIMMNHQSILDVLIVGRIMPKKSTIMAKSSLRYTPLGPFMTLAGAIFVDRGTKHAAKSLAAAGNKMKSRGLSLLMFPEGTRTLQEQPELKPFKKGGFHLAVQAEAVIVPVVAQNYWGLYHWGWFGVGTIRVRVLPPISTEGYTASDIPQLSSIVHDQMLNALRDISQSPKSVSIKPQENDPSSGSPMTAPEVKESAANVNVRERESAKDVGIGIVAATSHGRHVHGPMALDSSTSGSTKSDSFGSESSSVFQVSPSMIELDRGIGMDDSVTEEGIVLVGRPHRG